MEPQERTPTDAPAATLPPDGRPFDIDPENSGDKADHDRWLRDNVPPHNR
jgi:hypothetical protein